MIILDGWVYGGYRIGGFATIVDSSFIRVVSFLLLFLSFLFIVYSFTLQLQFTSFSR